MRNLTNSTKPSQRSIFPSSSNGAGSSSQNHMRNGAGSSNQNQEQLEPTNTTDTSRKTRGTSMCKEQWHLLEHERFKIQFNTDDQPIGSLAVKLSTSCGVVAKMGIYCPINYNDWRNLRKDFKKDIVAYMKERFIIPDDKWYIVLRKIGHCWNDHRCRLRKRIYKDERPVSEIIDDVPLGVKKEQWIPFVQDALKETNIRRSNKAKENRSKQTELHTCGSKSFARMREEMEAEKGEVGAIDFYKATHTKKNGQIDAAAMAVLNECHTLLEQRASFQDEESGSNAMDLQEEIIREVRGPEHPGRVRGAGMGPTPSKLVGTKRHARDVQSLKAELAVERAARAKLEAQVDQLKEMFQHFRGNRHRDDYRDRDYRRRSPSRSRDRHERDRPHGRGSNYRYRSRSRSGSPDSRQERGRDRYDDERRARSRSHGSASHVSRSPSPWRSPTPRRTPHSRDGSPDARNYKDRSRNSKTVSPRGRRASSRSLG